MSNREPHQKTCGWTHTNLRWYERRLIPKSPFYNTTQETKTWGEHIIICGYTENNTQQAFTILCWFIFNLNVKILALGSYVGVDPKLRQKKVNLWKKNLAQSLLSSNHSLTHSSVSSCYKRLSGLSILRLFIEIFFLR